jgi:hypothetical protein
LFDCSFQIGVGIASQVDGVVSGYEEVGGQLLYAVEGGVVAIGMESAYTYPGQALTGGLPIVLVGIERYLVNFESLRLVFVVELTQLHNVLGGVTQRVSGEIEEHDFAFQRGESTRFAVDVGQLNINESYLFYFGFIEGNGIDAGLTGVL